ncbi:unnamed protein product, partial [Polarella glacialis]
VAEGMALLLLAEMPQRLGNGSGLSGYSWARMAAHLSGGYNAAIGACENGRQWSWALELLRRLRDTDLRPTTASYVVLVSACGATSNWERALALSAEAREAGLLRPSTAAEAASGLCVYNAAISACEKARLWDLALCLLAELRDEGLSPGVVTFSAAISACEKAQRWEWALELLGEMGACRVKPELITYNSAISACENGQRWRWVLWLLSRLRADGLMPDVVTYNTAISGCAAGQRWELALALVATMRSEGLRPNLITYCAGATACMLSGRWTETLGLVAAAKEDAVELDATTASVAMAASENSGLFAAAPDMLFGCQASPIGFNYKSSATQTQMCGKRDGESEQERVVPPALERFSGSELHHEPGAWLPPDFLDESLVDHIFSLAPSKSSDAWGSCSGSVHYEVSGKRCAHVEVNSSSVHVKRFFEQIEHLWGITMPRPNRELVWLPMLHYAPGTTAIGAHADKYVSADGASDGGPDVSLFVYLTDTPAGTAQTTFPNSGVEVQPRKGAVLTWLNVDARTGLLHRNAVHAVEPVPLYSPVRIALCIPVKLFDEGGAKRPHVLIDSKARLRRRDVAVVLVVKPPAQDLERPELFWCPVKGESVVADPILYQDAVRPFSAGLCTSMTGGLHGYPLRRRDVAVVLVVKPPAQDLERPGLFWCPVKGESVVADPILYQDAVRPFSAGLCTSMTGGLHGYPFSPEGSLSPKCRWRRPAALLAGAVRRRTAGDLAGEESLLRQCVKRSESVGRRQSSGDAEVARLARFYLALQGCQTNRFEEADELLAQLGLSARLADEIWAQSCSQPKPAEFFADVLDNGLSAGLLERAREALQPESSYWEDHRYHDENLAFYSHAHLMGQ